MLQIHNFKAQETKSHSFLDDSMLIIIIIITINIYAVSISI